MEKAVIGLDVGTSSAKAVLYAEGSGVIYSDFVEFPEAISDGKTMDANGVLNEVTSLLSKTIKENKHAEIKAIGLSTIFPSLIALDKDGRPLTRVFTWMDNRASSIVADFKKNQKQAASLYEKTGCVIHESYSLWKILWLKKHNAEVFSKTYKFVSLSEYLTYKITGKFVVSEPIASTTGFFNIHELRWDKTILRMAGINEKKLSTPHSLFHSEKISDIFALKIGIAPGTLLVLGAGDGLLCHLASGCIKDGTMSSTVGTSGALRLSSNKPITSNPSIWCYYLYANKWVLGSAINAGGSSLAWFKRLLVERGDNSFFKELDVLAANSPIEGPIFFPFLNGERGPNYNQGMTASFFGLTHRDGVVSIYRSIVEGIFFNMYSCYELLANEAGLPHKIHASGGYINSDFMLQVQADIFNKEICVSSAKEVAAVGAAIVALKSIENASCIPEIKMGVERTVYPDLKKHRQYMQRYKTYKSIYNSLTKNI